MPLPCTHAASRRIRFLQVIPTGTCLFSSKRLARCGFACGVSQNGQTAAKAAQAVKAARRFAGEFWLRVSSKAQGCAGEVDGVDEVLIKPKLRITRNEQFTAEKQYLGRLRRGICGMEA